MKNNYRLYQEIIAEKYRLYELYFKNKRLYGENDAFVKYLLGKVDALDYVLKMLGIWLDVDSPWVKNLKAMFKNGKYEEE